MRSNVIRIHPAVVNLMDGDHDGDMCHIAMPLSPAAKDDMAKMDVLCFIQANPEEFKPGKEIAKYRPLRWAEDSLMLKYQIEHIQRQSTNGESISWRDLLYPEKKGYFTGTKVSRQELSAFSHGIDREEMLGVRTPSSIDRRGSTASDAIRSYRTIKTLVPKFGGLANSLMTLAIIKLRTRIESGEEKAMETLRRIAHAKHVLCQDGLSAKHGMNTVTSADKLHMAFYRSLGNKAETREDYEAIMRECGLATEDIEAILEVYWKSEPENINKMLKPLAPTYLATRRGAECSILEDIANNPGELSLQAEFLQSILKPVGLKEVRNVERHPETTRRCVNRIPRKPAAIRTLGQTLPQVRVERRV